MKEGDVISFYIEEWARVVEVRSLGTRRGPAPEAQTLYNDKSGPRPIREKRPINPKFEGKGRPTGKQRRELNSFSRRALD